MRFIKKEKKNPVHGETKIVRKFSLFPKTLGKITSWLQWDYILCVYVCDHEELKEYGQLNWGWNEVYFVRKTSFNNFERSDNGDICDI